MQKAQVVGDVHTPLAQLSRLETWFSNPAHLVFIGICNMSQFASKNRSKTTYRFCVVVKLWKILFCEKRLKYMI